MYQLATRKSAMHQLATYQSGYIS